MASQQETSLISPKDNIPNATNERGGLLTTGRWNKVSSSRRSINDEINFGDSGYEVKMQHEDRAKVEDGTKKELHVLKQQLRKNIKLHK